MDYIVKFLCCDVLRLTLELYESLVGASGEGAAAKCSSYVVDHASYTIRNKYPKRLKIYDAQARKEKRLIRYSDLTPSYLEMMLKECKDCEEHTKNDCEIENEQKCESDEEMKMEDDEDETELESKTACEPSKKLESVSAVAATCSKYVVPAIKDCVKDNKAQGKEDEGRMMIVDEDVTELEEKKACKPQKNKSMSDLASSSSKYKAESAKNNDSQGLIRSRSLSTANICPAKSYRESRRDFHITKSQGAAAKLAKKCSSIKNLKSRRDIFKKRRTAAKGSSESCGKSASKEIQGLNARAKAGIRSRSASTASSSSNSSAKSLKKCSKTNNLASRRDILKKRFQSDATKCSSRTSHSCGEDTSRTVPKCANKKESQGFIARAKSWIRSRSSSTSSSTSSSSSSKSVKKCNSIQNRASRRDFVEKRSNGDATKCSSKTSDICGKGNSNTVYGSKKENQGFIARAKSLIRSRSVSTSSSSSSKSVNKCNSIQNRAGRRQEKRLQGNATKCSSTTSHNCGKGSSKTVSKCGSKTEGQGFIARAKTWIRSRSSSSTSSSSNSSAKSANKCSTTKNNCGKCTAKTAQSWKKSCEKRRKSIKSTLEKGLKNLATLLNRSRCAAPKEEKLDKLERCAKLQYKAFLCKCKEQREQTATWECLKKEQKLRFYWLALTGHDLYATPYENFYHCYKQSIHGNLKKVCPQCLNAGIREEWRYLNRTDKKPFMLQALFYQVVEGKVDINDDCSVQRAFRKLRV